MTDTNSGATQPAADLKAVTNSYLEAFDARDLERCLSFFLDAASIDFQLGVFKGREAIENWHRDRFAANLRLTKIEAITVRGATVIIDGVATSDRLAAWKLSSIKGRVTLKFTGDKIAEAKFASRMMNIIDSIRSS